MKLVNFHMYIIVNEKERIENGNNEEREVYLLNSENMTQPFRNGQMHYMYKT
jgi:hypothetical protein